MKTWIFQGKPERYLLKEKLIAGNKEIWLVTRFRDMMTRGDIVLFWSSGDRSIRGLYGWGTIVDLNPKYYKNWGYGITVSYNEKFQNHLPISIIEDTGILKNNLIIRMPIGTNFKLTSIEATRLYKLIKSWNGKGPIQKNGGWKNDN